MGLILLAEEVVFQLAVGAIVEDDVLALGVDEIVPCTCPWGQMK